jgi:conjugal transfer pilus assembly protein TraK
MQTSANSFKNFRIRHSLMKAIVAVCLSASVTSAMALTSLDVRDGSSSTARISLKESTRIKVDGAAVKDLYGDIRSSGNPAGRLIVTADEGKGELYVRPSTTSTLPINVFVSTDRATYTLILLPTDIPADTVVLKDKSAGTEAVVDASAGRSSSYVRQLKGMIVAMATDRLEGGMRFVEINQSVKMWNEATTTLMRRLETSGRCDGEHYNLRESLGKTMRLDEREFNTKDVAAVAIDLLELAPYGSTNVYVIRCGGK